MPPRLENLHPAQLAINFLRSLKAQATLKWQIAILCRHDPDKNGFLRVPEKTNSASKEAIMYMLITCIVPNINLPTNFNGVPMRMYTSFV